VLNAQVDDSTTTSSAANFVFHPNRFSFRADLSVPNPVNAALRKSMVGVYEMNVSGNYHLSNGFFAGVGYKGNVFYTPPKFFIFDLKTRMQMNGGFINIGYDIHRSPGFFISPAFRTGWILSSFSGVQCKQNSQYVASAYQSAFVEALLHINYLPENNFGISFYLSFCALDHVWNPDYLCLQDHISYDGVNKNRLTTYINLGLGVYLGIGKVKQRLKT
jgi:hypothetical protein